MVANHTVVGRNAEEKDISAPLLFLCIQVLRHLYRRTPCIPVGIGYFKLLPIISSGSAGFVSHELNSNIGAVQVSALRLIGFGKTKPLSRVISFPGRLGAELRILTGKILRHLGPTVALHEFIKFWYIIYSSRLICTLYDVNPFDMCPLAGALVTAFGSAWPTHRLVRVRFTLFMPTDPMNFFFCLRNTQFILSLRHIGPPVKEKLCELEQSDLLQRNVINILTCDHQF